MTSPPIAKRRWVASCEWRGSIEYQAKTGIAALILTMYSSLVGALRFVLTDIPDSLNEIPFFCVCGWDDQPRRRNPLPPSRLLLTFKFCCAPVIPSLIAGAFTAYTIPPMMVSTMKRKMSAQCLSVECQSITSSGG